MGRFWIGIGLMLALLGIGLFAANSLNRIQLPIAQTLEQAAETKDPASAAALLQSATARWEKHWYSTAALADHGPMDEIDSLFAQAKAYVDAAQMKDFSALCMRLSQHIRATAESHKPTWWNLL